jgi:2-keto-4-pentenoate hydratase/2-oxohepta-3-ene-1,7-dioic acid hydratase in catechol pathway
VKIYRYLENGRPRVAVGDGERLAPHSGDAFDLGSPAGISARVADVKLLPPVRPGKIVAVGRNYADHAKELGNEPPAEPILFLKPPSAVLAPGGTIVRPPISNRVDFEGELAIVIGKTARNVRKDRWRDHVLGFTCANDVTARDIQKKDVQFTRGKSFDTFLPLGPCIETDLDAGNTSIVTRLNGEVRQNGTTRDMVFGCGALIEFITAVMTLEPGDVILTGTPAGVGALAAGDVVEIEIGGIGTLRNAVA